MIDDRFQCFKYEIFIEVYVNGDVHRNVHRDFDWIEYCLIKLKYSFIEKNKFIL
jgi:hypothetical protein